MKTILLSAIVLMMNSYQKKGPKVYVVRDLNSNEIYEHIDTALLSVNDTILIKIQK